MTKAQQKRVDAVESGISDIEQLVSELQDQFDDKSEAFQDGERGIAAQDEIGRLQDYLDNLQNIEIPTF